MLRASGPGRRASCRLIIKVGWQPLPYASGICPGSWWRPAAHRCLRLEHVPSTALHARPRGSVTVPGTGVREPRPTPRCRDAHARRRHRCEDRVGHARAQRHPHHPGHLPRGSSPTSGGPRPRSPPSWSHSSGRPRRGMPPARRRKPGRPSAPRKPRPQPRKWRSGRSPGSRVRRPSAHVSLTQAAPRHPNHAPRRASHIRKPQVTGCVTWGFSEPPVGFEPTTYALQVRCSGQLS